MAQSSDDDKVTKNDCCENKTTIIQADDDRAKSDLVAPTFQQLQQFAIAYVLAFHTEITNDKQSIQDIFYQPPVLSRDIYVLSEAFLL